MNIAVSVTISVCLLHVRWNRDWNNQGLDYYFTLLTVLLVGVIITGGNSQRKAVEVYNPVSQNTCSLDPLPSNRYFHTLCSGLLCGHDKIADSKTCLKWDAKTNRFSNASLTLNFKRRHSLCWAVDDDEILLLGGWDSPKQTEYILTDGSGTRNSFTLKKKAM